MPACEPFIFGQITLKNTLKKNLDNSANYLIRQNFIYGHGYLTYNQMASLMKKTEQYQALPAKVSQQVLSLF